MSFDPEAYTDDARKSWQAVAPDYLRLSAELFGPITRDFIDFAGVRPGERILDVACGPGTATLPIARAIGPSGRVVGVDLAFGMLKLAGERAAQSKLAQAEFREMNAEQLDFPDETFDAGVCQLGLMLFARPARAAGELARVVKRGGRVGLLVQGRAEGMQFTSLLMRALVKRAPQLKVPGAPTLYAFAPEGALSGLLKDAGLSSPVERRLSGAFSFASPQAYWDLATRGSGRTGAVLRSLEPAARDEVRREVFAELETLRDGDARVRVPYEVVMARAEKA